MEFLDLPEPLDPAMSLGLGRRLSRWSWRPLFGHGGDCGRG